MNALQDSLSHIQEKSYSEQTWISEFRKNKNITKLERSVVVTLIDRIIIHADKQIEIVYSWRDEYEWQLDMLARANEY